MSGFTELLSAATNIEPPSPNPAGTRTKGAKSRNHHGGKGNTGYFPAVAVAADKGRCRDLCTLCAGTFSNGCRDNNLKCILILGLHPYAPFLRITLLSIYGTYILLFIYSFYT